MKEMLETGALLGDKTDDQQRSLEAIETMLALIEGWVEAVTEEATKLLPKQAAISETVRRRRATGGPAELAFGTLVGLELRPRKLLRVTSSPVSTGRMKSGAWSPACKSNVMLLSPLNGLDQDDLLFACRQLQHTIGIEVCDSDQVTTVRNR